MVATQAVAGETELKILHDSVRYFVQQNTGSLSPSSLSDKLTGWPDLMRAIAESKPEDITLEQLRAFAEFTDKIADPLMNKSMGLAGILISDYNREGFKGKVAAAINIHPGNKAYALLRKFYNDHMTNMEDAIYAIGALDRGGEGYEKSQAAVKYFGDFLKSVQSLDPHFSPFSEYIPDVTKGAQELANNPLSALVNTNFDTVISLCAYLHNFLGEPVDKSKTSFGDHKTALEKAERQWRLVIQEMRRLQPARALSKP